MVLKSRKEIMSAVPWTANTVLSSILDGRSATGVLEMDTSRFPGTERIAWMALLSNR